MRIQIFLLFFWTIFSSKVRTQNLAKPIYQYLKDLCPTGQLPLTGSKTVKTCATICPLGAICYKGICCVQQPQCRHPKFRSSTGFACLPNVKNHCPDNSQCVLSTQEGMSVCCAAKISQEPKKSATRKNAPSPRSEIISTVASEATICPVSHPIIAHDGKSLILCKDCHQGICARFRKSQVEVCCQSSDDICGPGSQVLMDGFVPRDCGKKSCGKGCVLGCHVAKYVDLEINFF
ncbi:unnamed protein product [Caenorhabditis angaria]|uniref:WAP domain-containing protein n=1 Tax=Caenorhabditis angaria TaxID=860376 RepID=A0A9P1MYP7_9PELO|nr:unnamed protein product [Caenorhabditis angaria]